MTDGHDDWRPGGRGHEAWFGAASHADAAALAGVIAALLPPGAVLPDIEVRRTGIRVGLRDRDLREAVSGAARTLGLTADPQVLQRVGLQIDSEDPDRVTPFWQAAAQLTDTGDGALVDDLHRRPTLAFARAAGTSALRNRFHLDVCHPDPQGDAVAAALAAGGREAFTSQWYSTLADPDGNEVDLVPGGPWEGESTADWHTLFGAMVCYPANTAGAAAAFAATAAGLADAAGIDLMIDLRPEGVVLDSGKDQWEEVAGFPDLAAAVQRAARDTGLVADNRRLRFVQLALDAVDIPVVREFWRVVLGYEQAPNQDFFDLFDPRQLNPVLFLQRMDAADVERLRQPGRIRLDLQVPADQLAARIDLAVAAGGRIIERDPAGLRHRLADPEGNELILRVAR
ncbi:VOC family protein [Nakamurella sp. A5-74]|uniref:VOC family protein n=1 Tax=Nakamurella sp. A5-74 TaxID=3158264 RepID=A0AAU8DR86_9ACTN